MASELDLDRLSELEAKATPGPWRVDDPSWKEVNDITVWCGDVGTDKAELLCNMGYPIAAVDDKDAAEKSYANGELIAALRNAAPALIAAAREAEKLRELLLLCEFSGKYPKCPVCEGGIEFGHAPGCRLAAAIA